METAGSSNALDVSTPTQDLKFMQASNINVSNFVSVKLFGRINYKIWKAQMLCLIESQLLLHLIDAENHFPADKGVHMIGQYDKLVKGWIFGSVNEKVLNDLVDLGTAQVVWMKLELLFNPPVSDTEGTSSNALDVSAPHAIGPVVYAMREDLKYLQALNVDVSNFVSEKLVDKSNYYTWKNEMLYLIGSHELLHIIHAEEARFPWNKDDPMVQKYDSLVRGWILNTMNDTQHSIYRMYRSVQLMWRNLESTFRYQPETSTNINTKDDSSNETKIWKYKQLESNVNVSNFVWVKLSSHSNYKIWRDQMLSLIETHDLLHTFNQRYIDKMDIYDQLVRNWIIRTLNDELLKSIHVKTYANFAASSLWNHLESHFKDSHSMPEPVTQDLKYTQALNVTVSNFVSVKLSGRNNYEIWKAQMLCLIQSHHLLYIIDSKDDYTTDKYKHLVKGWIFSTMNEQLLNSLTSSYDLAHSEKSAKTVWRKLESVFDAPTNNRYRRDGQDPQELTFGIEFIKDDTEFVSDLPESDNTDKKRLYKAAVEGLWRKAKSIFKINKKSATEAVTMDIETKSSKTEFVKKELYEAATEGRWRKAKSILENGEIDATEAITANGNTILHVAVEMGHNYFVEKLLEFLGDGQVQIKNYMGQTALHIAAVVGNTNAARLLVQKTDRLLQIRDYNDETPLHLASENMNVNIYAYLFKSLTSSNLEVVPDWSQRADILDAIFSKQYDFVEKYLQTMSLDFSRYGDDIFMAMTITFPTDLRYTGSFIYPSFRNVCHKTAMRGSLLFNPDRCVDHIIQVVNMCSTCCSWLGKDSTILLVLIGTLYTMYQLICLLIMMLHLSFSMLYLLLWKVLAVTVQPIKNIEKKKKMYKEAKKIMRMMCKKMGPSNSGYSYSLFEAVRLDIYEVVDEILFTSPATINYKDEDGYNIIQASILNRAENVYNLIYHIIERTKSHREMIDSSFNNLRHLAGKLAPPFSISRTTGAALQLQRELLWFEEVKKLVLPLQLTKKNTNKETPAMVFTREHEALLSQGEIWMKKTAESCSITVALIVTVVFAASITVPGGNDQESGIPMFKKEISFTIFALANAFSLFTGATSLLLFLSILTARSSEKDFLVSLPRRLIFGLLTLFLSTVSMIVAFGAILFLVFCDKRPWMLVPICGFACLPISVIVTIKLPLLVDLIQSTYFPMFGKKRYIKGCKVNRKSTIFTYIN